MRPVNWCCCCCCPVVGWSSRFCTNCDPHDLPLCPIADRPSRPRPQKARENKHVSSGFQRVVYMNIIKIKNMFPFRVLFCCSDRVCVCVCMCSRQHAKPSNTKRKKQKDPPIFAKILCGYLFDAGTLPSWGTSAVVKLVNGLGCTAVIATLKTTTDTTRSAPPGTDVEVADDV